MLRLLVLHKELSQELLKNLFLFQAMQDTQPQAALADATAGPGLCSMSYFLLEAGTTYAASAAGAA